MGRAAVYKKEGTYLIHPWARTVTGLYRFWEPVVALGTDCGDVELADAVRSALAASPSDVPHPDPAHFKKLIAPLLRAAGAKSWTAFEKGASAVEVYEEDDAIVVMATTNKGSRGGFVHENENKTKVAPPFSPELGSAIRRML